MKKIFAISLLIVSGGFFIWIGTAWARDWEYYFEYKTKVPLNKEKKIFLNLKEETRYKDGVNYYRKSFFGLSKKLNQNWEVAFYYAFKEKRKDEWHNLHMFWPEVNYKKNFKAFTLTSNTKFERHCYANTHKFREKLKFIFPLNKKLNFWIGDEGRIFSFFNNPYFGENEVLCGFDIKCFKNLNLEIYYDLRRIKKEGNWENTNCLRTVFNFRF